MDNTIAQLFYRGHGVLQRSQHPELSHQFDWLLKCGAVVAPLPGILALPDELAQPSARIRAGALWAGLDAVLTGMPAARLTFWPDAPVSVVTMAVPGKAKAARPGWSVVQRRIPPELVLRRWGIDLTCPALTAVDLACEDNGGDIIDRALRSRKATLEGMWEAFALQPGRRGNAKRAQLLHDSRDRPWSEAEREGHRLLRAAGITGWDTNVWVDTAKGGYFVDVLFKRRRVVIEIDGWDSHGSRQAFENDRCRRNHLVLAGYTVLNFTWWQLTHDSEWVLWCIREALGC